MVFQVVAGCSRWLLTFTRVFQVVATCQDVLGGFQEDLHDCYNVLGVCQGVLSRVLESCQGVIGGCTLQLHGCSKWLLECSKWLLGVSKLVQLQQCGGCWVFQVVVNSKNVGYQNVLNTIEFKHCYMFYVLCSRQLLFQVLSRMFQTTARMFQVVATCYGVVGGCQGVVGGCQVVTYTCFMNCQCHATIVGLIAVQQAA